MLLIRVVRSEEVCAKLNEPWASGWVLDVPENPERMEELVWSGNRLFGLYSHWIEARIDI